MRWFHHLEYFAFRTTVAVVSRLPERFAYWLFARTADLYLRFASRRRELGRTNLSLAFPDADEDFLRRTLREATRNAFQNVLDAMLMLRHVEKGTFAERVDTSVPRALKPEGAFLGLAAHLGSWEVSAIGIASLVEEGHAIGRMPKNPKLAALLRQKRESAGLNLHNRRGGIRPLARALVRGHAGMLVVDQNQRRRGMFVPFFGKLASTDRSAATLALKRGYPIMFGTAVRKGPGFRFVFDVEMVDLPAPTGDEDQDLYEACAQINRTIEVFVRRYPSQYLWIHDRFRTRPPSETAECPASLAS